MVRTNQKLNISAVILSYNEELNIARTINSLRDSFAEIVVVDSGSSDRTVAVATECGARVVYHRYIDHASQWRWVFGELTLGTDWILLVDADFVFTRQAIAAIEERFSRSTESFDGFFLRHRYVFRGQQIRFGGTKTWWMRLVRRTAAIIDDSELVDFRVSVRGRSECIDALVLEENRKEDVVDFWIDKHQKFSTRLAAEEILKQSGALSWEKGLHRITTSEGRRVWMKRVWSCFPLGVRAPLYFFFRYLVLLGFLDGIRGFQFHFLQAFWFRVVVDMKIEEIRSQLVSGATTRDQLRAAFVARDAIG